MIQTVFIHEVILAAQPPSPTPDYSCQGNNQWHLTSPTSAPRSVELRLTIEKGVPCVYNKIGELKEKEIRRTAVYFSLLFIGIAFIMFSG